MFWISIIVRIVLITMKLTVYPSYTGYSSRKTIVYDQLTMIETRKSFQFVTGAKRLRQRVEDLEKELSEQKLVNQQQTLILLELIKVTNLNVQGIHFN